VPVQGVAETHSHGRNIELVLDKNATPKQVLERLVTSGITINRFEVGTPSLNEIFLEVAGKGHE
jgi:ABC-2 type transport system ATP-binding protein